MEDLYAVCKAFTDPVFIIFILLTFALIFCFLNRRKNNNVPLLFLSAAILLLYGLSIEPVANYLAYSLEKDYFHPPVVKKPVEVIIVLGGGVHDINPLNSSFVSETSAARLLHGVEMLNKYGAKHLICAGKGSAETAEGEVMAREALKIGVPKEKVRIDAQSNNTWEHAVELNKMLADKNIGVGIVTSGYHMKRSEREFKKYFNNVVPLPASYSYTSSTQSYILKYLPQTARLYKTSIMLREFIGSVWYKIKSL
jgi:uncharacterized SAM-binding protein YcdF (DUF218 family)